MQRLGRMLHMTPSNNVIIKIKKPPKIGSSVVDEKLKIIGKIFDVVGPVSSPYAIVKPVTKETETPANEQLYLLLPKK